MPYFVYILECVDKTYYCGYTTDLEKRLNNHNNSKNGAKYTRNRRPTVLKYFEKFEILGDALRREHQIKKLTRQAKTTLINSKSTIDKLPISIP